MLHIPIGDILGTVRGIIILGTMTLGIRVLLGTILEFITIGILIGAHTILGIGILGIGILGVTYMTLGTDIIHGMEEDIMEDTMADTMMDI